MRHWPAAQFVYVTDGAPRNGSDALVAGCSSPQSYAALRRGELHSAFSLAGVPLDQVTILEFRDQEASFALVELVGRMVDLLTEREPRTVLTHAYEGGHPDHDATAFAVHAACGLLQRARVATPAIFEMTSYHAGPGGIRTGKFLPAPQSEPVRLELGRADVEFKRSLLACFASQQATLQYFGFGCECFRIAPRYDFQLPPHPGRLFYEHFDWGLDGSHWRRLASEALTSFELRGVL